MLCNLMVENYALISKLEIEFRKGLTIITGETGAGKSILLGALSLILGKRADTSVLLNKEKKCIVEGTFEISHYGLRSFFEENSLDYDDQSILRREISTAGKSRAFINDVPVNLDVLTQLGIKLIDIHSQHQNLNLSDSVFQVSVIDTMAHNDTLLMAYQAGLSELRNLQSALARLSEEAERSRADLDYLTFQYSQLEEARLKEGEQEELENELEKLAHTEEIKTGLSGISSLLLSEPSSALYQLKESLSIMHRIGKYLKENHDLSERLESAYIEIKDLTGEISAIDNGLYFDPERLAQTTERLNLLHNLEKKHKVPGLSELIAFRDQLGDKIQNINAFEFNRDALELQIEGARSNLVTLANQISEKRRRVIPQVEKHVTELLHEVGMPHAIFNVALGTTEDFHELGTDHVMFMFTANKNMPVQDIIKVASGGEMSRLMLCIKSLLSDSTGLPTIIFDEIDSGVSGDIAERVGNIINRMAGRMQIINITHLPQVASKGKYHYLVYKTDGGSSTSTRIKLLSPEERQMEIAKMLSGEEITSAAMENAKALLGN